MNATFKMLSTLRDEKYAKMANEELAIAYQNSDLNASILAEMYCRNFTILYNLASKFYSIPEDDKASIITQQLNTTMQAFDANKGVKYITFAIKDINEKFVAYLQKYNRKGRINFCDCSSLSNDTEDNTGYDNDDNFITYNPFDNYMSEVELIDTIKHSNLSLIEKKVCYLFMKSDTCTREEIANKLGVSRQTVQIAIKNLKQKLKFVLD